MPPRVFLIILNYNKSLDTVKCLDSVAGLDYQNREIVIVDNNSKSPKVENLSSLIEARTGLKLLANAKNLGYSGGNNVGIKYALEHGADYVFILNPDTAIEKGSLSKLIEAAESDPKIGIIGPAINEGNRTIYGSKISWLKSELTHSFVVTPSNKYSILDTDRYITGAAILIKREVIEKIGLLDESYFLYFEDADYCLRASRAGFNLAIVPQAKVTHVGSASTGSLGSALLLRYHYRNAHLFNWKSGPLLIKFALPFWSLFIIMKQLVKIIFWAQRREISRTITVGVVDFYREKFGKIND